MLQNVLQDSRPHKPIESPAVLFYIAHLGYIFHGKQLTNPRLTMCLLKNRKNSFPRKGFDRGRTQICNPRSDIQCLATRLHGRSRQGSFVQGSKNVLCCRQQLWCDHQIHGGQTLKTNDGRLTQKPFNPMFSKSMTMGCILRSNYRIVVQQSVLFLNIRFRTFAVCLFSVGPTSNINHRLSNLDP